MANKKVRRGLALSAPTKYVFWIAFLLLALGIAAHFIKLDFLREYSIDFWCAAGSGVVFLLGALFKGI